MADERTQALPGVNPAGLLIVLVALIVSGVGFTLSARAAKEPTATWDSTLCALGSILVGIVLVEVGSWLNARFYRGLEKSALRPWIENAGGVALVLGIVLFGNFLVLYSLGISKGYVAGMLAGLLLIELALAAGHRSVIRICTSPSFPVTMVVVAAAALGVVALTLVSVINVRHYRRVDLTEKGEYTLDERTVKILKTLTKPLRIISTMVQNPNPRMGMEQFQNAVRARAAELLDEYASQSSKVEHIPLNLYANPERADQLARELKVDILRDSVMFAYEGKTKTIEFNDLISQSPAPWEEPAFQGEEAFTSALQTLVEGVTTKIYFVKGHGERDVEDYNDRGLSKIAELVRNDNCEVKTIELPEIPDDCDVLVVAGPKTPYLPAEVDALRTFLTEKRKGLVVLLDPVGGETLSSGLEPFLKEQGLDVHTEQTIIEIAPREILPGVFGREPSTEIATTDYGAGRGAMLGPPHPIIRDMKNIRTAYDGVCPVVLQARPNPRNPYGPPGDPNTAELVKTSSRAFAKTDFDPSSGERIRLDPERDKPGPFCIAAAHGKAGEEPPPNPMMPQMPPPPGRLVVFGDSDFVTNRFVERAVFGNSTLFRNTVAWVAGKEYKIGIPPKPLRQERHFDIDSEDKALARWATVFVPPFHILVLGIVVWWIRHR